MKAPILKKISFLPDLPSFTGAPISARLQVFRHYFEMQGFVVDQEKKGGLVLITMPPFRNFGSFFNPKNKIILDIRDGWSIAQVSGYGGTTRKKPVKAFLSRLVERFIIRRSCLAITCTPGLVSHLEKVSGRKVALITNGVSDDRVDLIAKLRAKCVGSSKEGGVLKFVCAGQFSEYGYEKAKKLLNVISDRYPDKRLVIELIGSDPSKNTWTMSYFSEITAGRGVANILPRMDERALFKQMLSADYGLTIIRDPLYELGTKVYDYIALGLPVVNYFDEPNNFTDYFDACLDVPFGRNSKIPEIRRSVLIEKGLKNVDF